ncbi:ETC complex I subunit conserved region-domain-containing protein [Neohortaea acidophila]|uniref:NADH dehydrogenase [ubiquinone] iron-sulfur protein 4, mitochondrial n=1 Tax=Neohortaea acidophila TaxID=245834 RepID=A0A6A6Q9X4_9PEZI|nr:ETC complex I subunit conserved region-domain-containing protein [Neohortaea acidophila]KAF2488217.1 ETC complex I subunit conserved region-domain-containing protein [Neohortaea acidophila]
MASLQRTAVGSLRTLSRIPLSRRSLAGSRLKSTTPAAAQPPIPLAGIISYDGPSAAPVTSAMERDNPDYHVVTDYRVSNFSPIPIRVMDGSEAGETLPAAVLSGAPIELQARTVRIFRQAKPATQSGDWHSHHWRMDWDPLGKGHRWENPLMGWQSSADFMQGTHLSFKSKDDAIRFANKQGYEYFVQEPNERKFVPKAYADQFVHIAKPLKEIRTK